MKDLAECASTASPARLRGRSLHGLSQKEISIRQAGRPGPPSTRCMRAAHVRPPKPTLMCRMPAPARSHQKKRPGARTHARTHRSNARKQADRDMSRTRAHSDRDLHLQLQPVRCATHAADVAGAWPPLGETRKLVWAPHPQVDGSISTGRPDALDAQL